MSKAIRVLIVDDSALHRRAVTESLVGDDSPVEVVGYAKNGQEALEKMESLNPDLVTLDIEMPIMNGIECLKEARQRGLKMPIVAVSTLTMQGAKITIECLTLGAQDYVHKPQGKAWADSVSTLRSELMPRVLNLTGRADGLVHQDAIDNVEQEADDRPSWAGADLIAIGSATGGPAALQTLLSGLPSDLSVPVVVAQHMPKMFTKFLADRLDAETPLRVVEGEDGMQLEPGVVVIAPGDFHLKVDPTDPLSISTSTEDAVHSARPAIDILFQSIASQEELAGRTMTVVLTGMGKDALEGTKELHAQGSRILVQDEATSAAWSMPGGVVQAGLSDHILPIEQIASTMLAELDG